MAEPLPSRPGARLAVLGSPIAHSKSPALHRAAYSRLGLDWEYTAVEMTGERLPGFIDGLDDSWRGLSLTMPLKQDVLALVDEVDELVRLTGAANTVVFDDGVRRGFNTDVGGIVRALGESGVGRVRTGALIGAGATAASALIAMAELGAREVRVLVRRPGSAAALGDLGRRAGVVVDELPIDALAELGAGDAELVIATVPGGSDLGVAPSAVLVDGSVLLDVAYDPWPSTLGAAWLARSGRVVHGLGMLLHQALLQVRVFVHGDPFTELPDEDDVLRVMREAVR
ncbi:shikimate dehydrogenase [Agromyces sp. H3Y2-19a]|uniref:shikimate dehydrogenase n=1 Tax=Agromyces chromiiresistens TaxID=3030835 RepID=UPI0023B974B4|nr:shikimate dehydrogenase [Agromyces chromiiresistens]MDF0515211.1 shikimate dehydrogenase [Agromyces chromiiresistens]